MLGNVPAFLFAWLGSSYAGVISVPLSYEQRGTVLESMLAQSSPAMIITDLLTLAEAGTVIDSVPSIEKVVVVDGNTTGSMSAVDMIAPIVSYENFVSDKPIEASATQEHPHAGDTLSIMFTSGTTGGSKGVVCSHRMALGFAETAAWSLGLTGEDVSYTSLPLSHVNALYSTFLASLLCESEAVISRRFSVTRYWKEVKRSGATVASLLSSMATLLMRATASSDEQSHNLRMIISAPRPRDLVSFEKRFNARVTEIYGLTDAGLPLGIPFGERAPAGACGKPAPNWECQLVDDDDNPVSPGAVGELVLRPLSPHLTMSSYWKQPDATVAAWRNLWLHTGDFMRTDADGWYYFVDRKKDLIRRFGENISTFDIEVTLAHHSAVAEVAAYAVESEVTEQEVGVTVILRDEHGLGSAPEQELLRYCEANLPYFAVPRFWRIATTLPRNASGKVLKRLLTADAMDESWDAGWRGRSKRTESR